jgi:glucose/arabinose dehydrogenase
MIVSMLCVLGLVAACAPAAQQHAGPGLPAWATRSSRGAACNRPGPPVLPARLSAPTGLHVPAGFEIQTIASIPQARELAALPNGDLLVGTLGSQLYIVPNAEGAPGAPRVFASIGDQEAAGVAFATSRCEIYVGSTYHVWAIRYRGGERSATHVEQIGSVRTGPEAPGTDGDVHTTTSVAYAGGVLYVSAGSSCNATMDGGSKPCTEVDPTRAAITVMSPNGAHPTQRAKRIRNAIALAVDPQSQHVWVGGAGQDDLPFGHPYEYLDDLSIHPGDADYGWPECEENHHAYWPGYDCSKTVEPLVELPAYATLIGAVFYPFDQTGRYAFPPAYRGALFATAHGSWHTTSSGCSAQPPRVVFVPMNGDRPRRPVDWRDPVTQWHTFIGGFQSGCTARRGRPTGIAVGPLGSLFVADDAAGLIYRIRPDR